MKIRDLERNQSILELSNQLHVQLQYFKKSLKLDLFYNFYTWNGIASIVTCSAAASVYISQPKRNPLFSMPDDIKMSAP